MFIDSPRKYLIGWGKDRDFSSRHGRLPASAARKTRQAGMRGKWGPWRGFQGQVGKPNRYPMPVSALICFCTCPDPAMAERIAETLVAERLAACVNVLPGLRSVYRWQGAVERADEVLLLIKTTPDRYPQLQDRLPQIHPHELPELVAVETDLGLPAYLRWIADETRPEPPTE
jgi:periplasmic divalent cation tolerance protein